MTTYTCEGCLAPSRYGVTCDPCEVTKLRSLLNSKAWMATRGVCSGDLPGETLADTIRRELRRLAA